MNRAQARSWRPGSADRAPSTARQAVRRRRATARSGLWRNRDFLLFWGSESISLIGTQVTELALPLTAVLVLSVDPVGLGTLRFAQFAPFLIFSLLFGVLVDSRRKRPLMVVANGGRAVLVAMVPVLYVLGRLDLPVLYVVAFLVGTLTVLFDLCWMSYVPLLVTQRQQLTEANGKIASSVAIADVAGPGVAGALVQIVTAPVALLLDAVSYVGSVFSLLAIRTVEPAPPRRRRPGRRRIGSEIVEGLRWVAATPYVRTPTVVAAGYNFFYLFAEAILPLYVIRTLGFSAGQYGLVLSISSVGALLGAAMSNTLVRKLHLGRTYVIAVLIGYSAPLLILLVHGRRGTVLVALVAALFLRQLGASVANVIGISLRQAVTPQHLMGRTTAAVRMLLYGCGAIGAPIGGIIAVSIGLRGGLWIAAAGSSAVAIMLLFSALPRVRALPDVATA
jgi:MFS family permease